MVRSRVKNDCLKKMSQENKWQYARQKNYYVKLLRYEKKNLDKKNYWQEKILANCKAFFFKQKSWFRTNYFNNHTIDCNQHCNNGVIL